MSCLIGCVQVLTQQNWQRLATECGGWSALLEALEEILELLLQDADTDNIIRIVRDDVFEQMICQ